MTTRPVATRERQRRAVRRRMLTSLGLGLGLAVALMSEARASTYRVYTSPISAMSKAPNDGYCSLAEAVEHVNGNAAYRCTDDAPGSAEHRIELLQASGRSFSAYHYKITTLTINSSKRVTITGSGGLPFVDFTGTSGGGSAFKITSGDTVFFNRVNLTNTAGTAGGRLVENFGTLQFFGVTMANGDVTGSYHTTGNGGAIYNNGGTISLAQNSLITGNRARRGGAIYNNDGKVTDLFSVTISGNSATMGGGGIYNMSSASDVNGTPIGSISADYSTITGNSAPAGGGVFNRGELSMDACSITSNTASGTGSDEICHKPLTGAAVSCDGSGGGILGLSSVGRPSRTNLYSATTVSNNKASMRGGGIYNAGQFLVHSSAINYNEARYGAAIYTAALAEGEPTYCEISKPTYPEGLPQSSIVGNKGVPAAADAYSIVDSSGVTGAFCSFDVTASGNIGPWCEEGSVKPTYPCPQTAP